MNKTTFMAALVMHGFSTAKDLRNIEIFSKGEGTLYSPNFNDYISVALRSDGIKANPLIEIRQSGGTLCPYNYDNYEEAYIHAVSEEGEYVKERKKGYERM